MARRGWFRALALVIQGAAMVACRGDASDSNGGGAAMVACRGDASDSNGGGATPGRNAYGAEPTHLARGDAGNPDGGRLVEIASMACGDAGLGDTTRRGKCSDGEYHIQ